MPYTHENKNFRVIYRKEYYNLLPNINDFLTLASFLSICAV